MQEHIVIIGNGISGITCARHIRKNSNHRITVISAETKHFFSRTALMYIYMGHMRYVDTKPYEDFFWEKNRIELLYDYVENVDVDKKTLSIKSGANLKYDKLVIASGSKSNKFGWPGQDLKGVQGLYSYPDLELMEENTKDISRAVVVGGGLIGVEMAEMLHSRNIPVSFLVRESGFWNNVLPPLESELIGRHIREHGIDLQLSTELESIEGDENGKVKAVITKSGEKIECQFVGLTVGVHPNIDFLKSSGIETEKGVLVNKYLETNIEDVYAIGDCAQFREAPGHNRRNVEQVWYTGRMHGEALAHTLCGNKTAYRPGNWFNSAKFFDIEYQTYGWVMPGLQDNELDFYWEDLSGKKALHFVFDKTDKVFKGINALGIRLRHEIVDRWLTEKRTVEYILEHFKDANFDPEFSKKYEKEIVEKYNAEFKTDLKVRKKNLMKIFKLN
ncbi:MAG: FAD-dependent oxidoreductase [Chitinophagales bacterium]